jgi:hypothetical protein
MGCHMC